MARYALLMKYTDKGIAAIKDSPARAADFKNAAAKLGVTLESIFWLQGEYDGLIVLAAPSEEAVSALTLQLASKGFVRTCLCRAYDEVEFKAIVAKM
jgi:uncharacterized protein with GYD domain